MGRPITKDEAFLILSGWRDSGAAILVNCEVAPLAFGFRGRILELVEFKRVRLLSFDGVSEFVFDIKDDFNFRYTDPRDFPEDAREVAGALVFFFSPRPEYATEQDFIALSELT